MITTGPCSSASLAKCLLAAFCAVSPALAQQASLAVVPDSSLPGKPLFALAEPTARPLDSADLAVAVESSSALSVRRVPIAESTIEVNAAVENVENGEAVVYHVTQLDVLSSAGTYRDFSRYLQVLPGVVWNSDMSNDVLVRGGHPSENLYVVDGIEVPNINHLAVEGSTGGFTSMIDTATVGSVDMKPGAYDARYSSRLSSLIEIHTLEPGERRQEGDFDAGMDGVGGFVDRQFGQKASLLLSGHRSILDLMTDNIGLDGVPVYSNGMARLEWSPGKRDRISALSLNGADSIAITPCANDDSETLLVDTQYGGIRSTDGLVWQHEHSPMVLSSVTASYTQQDQDIGQQMQAAGAIQHPSGSNPCQAFGLTDVYQERTHDGTSTLGYSLGIDRHGWFLSAGSTARLASMNYRVNQPAGQQSPFSSNAAWTDADAFARNIATGQTGSFADVTGHLGGRWTLMAGAREETFALTGAHQFEPRASLALRLNQHQAVNATFGRSSQLAPSINILSYAQNSLLRPLEAQQFSLGSDVWRTNWATASIGAYRKTYSHEPVSTEYPSLMLANMVDTLGQEFVWLPLKTGGRGQSEGLELLVRAHLAGRIQLFASTSYGRTMYAAADRVFRPGNYDFPLVNNSLATLRLHKTMQLSLRNTFASGRPYTPFNVPVSEQQQRGIYDLSQVNALRGPAYNRLDADLSRSFRFKRGLIDLHLGVENALNRKNFLGYAWLDRCVIDEGPDGKCTTDGVPQAMLTQMPVFPSAGLRYSF